jgi:hypothetical protein
VTVPPVELSKLTEAVDRVRHRERLLMDYIRGSEFTLEGLRGKFLE